MKRMLGSVGSLLLCVAFVWIGMRFADKKALSAGVISLDVVASSNTEHDLQCKQLVHDAILQEMQALGAIQNAVEVKEALVANLASLEETANQALASAGSSDTVTISVGKEEFSQSGFEAFSLPAGVYESLQVTIGQGAGEDWQCVLFPTFCVGATSEDVRDIASGAGFTDSLAGAIAKEDGFVLDFYFLELLGRLENLFYDA